MRILPLEVSHEIRQTGTNKTNKTEKDKASSLHQREDLPFNS